jgi:hypothetical protein
MKCDVGACRWKWGQDKPEAEFVVRTKRFIEQSACAEHARMFRELGMFADVVQIWPVDDMAFVHAFERIAYGGYTAYGYSMSDGYYAPIQREAFNAELIRSAKAAESAQAFFDQNFRYDTEFHPSVEDCERYMRKARGNVSNV